MNLKLLEGRMDNSILRKRLNTFKSAKGTLSRVSNEVIFELLRAWENWPGTSADFYRDLDVSRMQLAVLLKKAKKLVKNGTVMESEFKEIALDVQGGQEQPSLGKVIELAWGEGKLLRFYEVEQLIDFLKKVA
jgi:hypothetical protein